MADDKGSTKKSRSKATKESLGLTKVNLEQVEVRRRNMLDSEIFVSWDSYRAESTALASKLITKVSVRAGNVRQPTILNILRSDEYPDDYVLEPSNQKDSSSIEVRWESPTKAYLYLESLLIQHPLGIPVDHKAYMKLTPYPDENGTYLRLHYSDPRYAKIAEATPSSKGDEKETEAKTDKKKTGTEGEAKEGAKSESTVEAKETGKSTETPSTETAATEES